jgi:hypothetical protein
MKRIAFVLALVVGTSMASAQGSSHTRGSKSFYPATEEVRSAMKDADYAFRRFQEVTGQINFGRWNAPHETVDAHERGLESTVATVREEVARIDALQTGTQVVSKVLQVPALGFDLFDIYEGLISAQTTSLEMAGIIDSFGSGDIALAADLVSVATP